MKNGRRVSAGTGSSFWELEQGRQQAVYAVNSAMVHTYWEIGREIVEFEQHGNEKAEYGSGLLNRLSKDLTIRYGSGFSLSNSNKMRKMYLTYPILQTVSAEFKQFWTTDPGVRIA